MDRIDLEKRLLNFIAKGGKDSVDIIGHFDVDEMSIVAPMVVELERDRVIQRIPRGITYSYSIINESNSCSYESYN